MTTPNNETITLTQNTFCFDSAIVNDDTLNATFGVLEFSAVTCSETTQELEILFTVDCSGSMCDVCSDGKSKMKHIIHTLKNMILFLHEKTNTVVNVTINAFDDNLYNIIKRTPINAFQVNHILSEIDKLKPLGSTNIEKALKDAAVCLTDLKTQYPDKLVSHIFMTDGESTHGSTDVSTLQSLVLNDVLNAFIGFGVEHDSHVMNGLGSVEKSCYYFVDTIENAGFVYGEILHSILYKVLTNCEIHIENGLVYDFKTNTWVNALNINDVVSEATKSYNIVSTNPNECAVSIKGTRDAVEAVYASTRTADTELTKHWFRQKTMQLMFEVNQFCNIGCESEVVKNELKAQMTSLMDEMKQFITTNDITSDKFMKNLCDDIYICFRTFDTKYGKMFCSSRHQSQGTQRQYTVSNTDSVYGRRSALRPYRMRANKTSSMYDMSSLETQVEPYSSITQHTVSGMYDTPYLTRHGTQVMEYVSDTNML